MQNFLLAARAQGLGTCLTSWASYGGEPVLREAVGVPDDWMLAGHVVVGWPPRQPRWPVRADPSATWSTSTDGTDRRQGASPASALGTDFWMSSAQGKLPE